MIIKDEMDMWLMEYSGKFAISAVYSCQKAMAYISLSGKN